MEEVSRNDDDVRFRRDYGSNGSLEYASDIDLSLVDSVLCLTVMLSASEMHVAEMSELHGVTVVPGTLS